MFRNHSASFFRIETTYVVAIISCGPFYKHILTLIPAWISNHIRYKVWDEITYSFLNFNGVTVDV